MKTDFITKTTLKVENIDGFMIRKVTKFGSGAKIDCCRRLAHATLLIGNGKCPEPRCSHCRARHRSTLRFGCQRANYDNLAVVVRLAWTQFSREIPLLTGLIELRLATLKKETHGGI